VPKLQLSAERQSKIFWTSYSYGHVADYFFKKLTRFILHVIEIIFTKFSFCLKIGRPIAEAVSRWLPTAAARVRSQVWSSGICGGQSGAGAGFLRVLWFPYQFLFHQILHPHNHPGQVQ
jgi:hypothetical protein